MKSGTSVKLLHKIEKKRDCDCFKGDVYLPRRLFLFFFFVGSPCMQSCVPPHLFFFFSTSASISFSPSYCPIPTDNINMSPSKTSAASNAAAEALQNDQIAFHKHLQELSTMVKEIEAKLKPTINK